MSNHGSLPEAWVSRSFAEMRANYGVAFDRQWEAPAGEDGKEHAAMVKAQWGRALVSFGSRHECIRWALDNLPERPPTLPEFAGLCRRMPQSGELPALPAPSEEGMKRVADTLRCALNEAGTVTRVELVERMKRKLADGQRLSAAQRWWCAAQKEFNVKAENEQVA